MITTWHRPVRFKRACGKSTIPGMAKTRLDVDWEELEDAFDQGTLETVFYLDLETGRVVVVSEDLLGSGEDLGDEADDPYQEMREVREAVDAGSERYLPIPDRDDHEGWRDMEAFVATVRDGRLASRLERAIAGRGAFRYFRDVLRDHPHEERRWQAFERRRTHERMVDWLESVGVEATNAPDVPEVAPSEEPEVVPAASADERLLEELTLVSLYLSSWEEGKAPYSFRRAWKGHRFEVLDALDEQGLVAQGRPGTKSLHLTDEGVARARELLQRLREQLGAPPDRFETTGPPTSSGSG